MKEAVAGTRQKDVNNIIIVRTDHIGDAVMTIPLIRETRKVFPKAVIDLILAEGVAPLFQGCPYVDRIIPIKTRVWRRADSIHQVLRMWRLRRCLFSDRHPDLVLSPRRGPEADGTALAVWATGGKVRVGYRKGFKARPLSALIHDWCFTTLIDPAPPEHEVCANLRLLEMFGADRGGCDDSLEFWIRSESEDYTATLLANAGVEAQEEFIVMAPGAASGGRNMWPVERFAAVALSIYQRKNIRTVLVGSPGERALANDIEAQAGAAVVNMCGHTSLLALAAILARAVLLVGNDSGAGHIAAALGKPTVTISSFPIDGDPGHPNSVLRFRPYGRGALVIQPRWPAAETCVNGCSMKEAHCILDVSIERVVTLIHRALDKP